MINLNQRYSIFHKKLGYIDLLDHFITLLDATKQHDILDHLSKTADQGLDHIHSWLEPLIINLVIQSRLVPPASYQGFQGSFRRVELFLQNLPAEELDHLRYVIASAFHDKDLAPLEMYLLAHEGNQ